MNTNEELLELVQALSDQVDDLRHQVRGLTLLSQAEVGDDVLLAIAAGVAAYLGYGGEPRQRRFATSQAWNRGTRLAQLNHTPRLSH